MNYLQVDIQKLSIYNLLLTKQFANLVIDVWRERESWNVTSHSLNNFELSFIDDNSTVGQNKFGNSVNGHPLEDVEVDGVVMGGRGDGP